MHAKKPVRKNLVFDVGAGSGEFTRLLQKRNPKDKVIGIDFGEKAVAEVKMSGGAFFKCGLKEPGKVKSVWLNHVSILSHNAFADFLEIVEKVPSGTPFVLTMRKENMGGVRNALEYAGLKIKSEKKWSPKMLGSPFTKTFYEQANMGNFEKQPIRIVAVKSKNWVRPKDF